MVPRCIAISMTCARVPSIRPGGALCRANGGSESRSARNRGVNDPGSRRETRPGACFRVVHATVPGDSGFGAFGASLQGAIPSAFSASFRVTIRDFGASQSQA
jgi:hypothetical protein